MTCSGGMRERVTFQEETEASDGGGGYTMTWGNISTNPTMWARVQPVRGGEAVEVGRLAALQMYLVTVRHRTDLNTGMRIVWGSKTMNIRTITNRDEKRKFLTIEAQDGAAN